jgi:hypothetical protein
MASQSRKRKDHPDGSPQMEPLRVLHAASQEGGEVQWSPRTKIRGLCPTCRSIDFAAILLHMDTKASSLVIQLGQIDDIRKSGCPV